MVIRTFRPLPDNQEVFISQSNDISIIVEVLQTVPESEGQKAIEQVLRKINQFIILKFPLQISLWCFGARQRCWESWDRTDWWNTQCPRRRYTACNRPSGHPVDQEIQPSHTRYRENSNGVVSCTSKERWSGRNVQHSSRSSKRSDVRCRLSTGNPLLPRICSVINHRRLWPFRITYNFFIRRTFTRKTIQ